MEIKFFSTIWGMDHLPLEECLKRIKEAGFDGLEMDAPSDNGKRAEVKRLLEKYELLFLAQQKTEGKTPADHRRSIAHQMKINCELNPLFINSHTGRDYFSVENNLRILEYSDEISEKYGVKTVHETHRGRFAYSPITTGVYLDKMPSLQLTADFSHWCCVSESLLEDQNENVNKTIDRALHIHARVGYQQGPQVTDPRATEWKEALDTHLKWWDKIIGSNRNNKMQTITPEFGPPAYLHTLPYTNVPVADQWEINCFMKRILKERYAVGKSELSLIS